MGTRRVVVIGSGGHAKVVLDALLAAKADVLGLADANADRHGARVLGAEVQGDDRWVDGLDPAKIVLVNGIGSTGDTTSRRAVFERFKSRGFDFLTVVHPSAVVGAEVVLEEGTQVLAGAIIQAGTRVGPNSIVNTGACVDHDCRVGAHSHISPGAVICGGVTVGVGCHVGAGAVLIQSVSLGERCVVGAGAVVLRGIGNDMRVAGVPARGL